MRRAVVLLLGVMLLAGCGGSGSAPTAPQTTTANQTISANLRDRFLFDHNATFNDGRTFRWVPPIPIFIVTGDDEVDALLLEQFVAWENALAGAGGTPFYAPQAATNVIPRRGIFLAVADLPGKVVGLGNPFFLKPQASPGTTVRAERLRQLRLPAAPKRIEIPEVTAGGEIGRCALVLDPELMNASDATFKAVVRHEVGHCLGFIGHVSSGLMKPTCCALNFTPDVTRMMRQLYGLDPGTAVTR